MDSKSFIASIIKDGVWPLILFVVLCYLRLELKDLVSRISDLEIFGNKAKFSPILKDIKRDLDRVERNHSSDTVKSPDELESVNRTSASNELDANTKAFFNVQNSWNVVENSLQKLANRRGKVVNPPKQTTIPEYYIQQLNIDENIAEILRRLRFIYIGGAYGTQIQPSEAVEYQQLAMRVAKDVDGLS